MRVLPTIGFTGLVGFSVTATSSAFVPLASQLAVRNDAAISRYTHLHRLLSPFNILNRIQPP